LTSGTILNSANNVFGPTANSSGSTAQPLGTGQPLGIQTANLLTGGGNTQQLNVFTVGDLAIGAKISTSLGGLVKSGPGSLYLTNATNSYSGGTTVNAGSLVIDSLADINDAPGNLL